MSAPRVLVSGVVLGQPMGGVRRHNMELLPRLARLLADAGGGLAVLAGSTGVAFELPAPIECLPSGVPAHPPFVRALLEARALRSALSEARERGRPFDLVHTAHFPVPRALPVPYTLTIHDLRHVASGASGAPGAPGIGGHARRALARSVIGRAARKARAVITVSASVQRGVIEELCVPAERVHVVPNAADHFAPLPRRAEPGARLLCLGHLEPRKNLELVLRALARDPSLPGLDLRGAEKPGHAARLQALARALGVADRVAFLGPFDDAELPRLLAQCAALVLPSRIEGFGIAALEAQRACVPLAVARIPALVEVAGERVPCFDPGAADECARAIRAALGRERAELDVDAERAARFTWDASARAWCAALASAASAS